MVSADPTIACPNCGTAVKLTESLAAPLIEATRKQYEQKIAQQNADVARREETLSARAAALEIEKATFDAAVAAKLKAERDKLATETAKRDQAYKDRETQLAKERESLDAAIVEKTKAERARIAAEETRKVKLALGDELEQKAKELTELTAVLATRNEKLAEAQKAQAALLVKQRELDDARREMDLTIETQVSEKLLKVRETAKRDAEQELSLKVIEKDLAIQSMMAEIDSLKRKAEQSSQQLQGEALEWQLETLLAEKFLHDKIDPVPKGEHGGDILHRVHLPAGTHCGTILWETKRVKNWQDGWLPKLRNDQRVAKADVAILVSSVLPKDVDTFDQIDGVWVVHPRCILPVTLSLRTALIDLATARLAGQGQQTKMELVYTYLTGPRFRLRVEALAEAFTSMNDDLFKEKKAVQKQWAKREEQITRMMEATVGMYGELQGIAGKTLGEVKGLQHDDSPKLIPND